MPIRLPHSAAALAASLCAVIATPANAQDYGPPPPPPVYAAAPAVAMPQYHPAQRAEWLDACEARQYRRRTWGWTGPLLGAGLGGLAGNRIASRHDRTIGTVAGAVAGGLVGAAVDRSRGTSRERARAWCEAYLDEALADYSRWYASQPQAVAPPPAPVIQQRRCTETTTVTTEEVPASRRR